MASLGWLVHHPDQIGKIHPQAQILPVGVHVLAQEGDVLIPGGDQLPGLGHHLLGTAGALPAPDVGDDAVGTEVVAAVHDGEPRLHLPVAAQGYALGHGAVVLRGGEDALFRVHHPLEKLREAPELMGPEDQIHHRVGAFELLGHMLLLHHAAADGDDLPGAGFLRVVEGADVAQHAHLRMLAHSAGVDHDHVRLKLVLRKAVAHLGQIPAQLLAVGLVLLAAVGVHQGQGPGAVGGHAFKNLGADLLLAADLLRVDGFSLIRHGVLLRDFN